MNYNDIKLLEDNYLCFVPDTMRNEINIDELINITKRYKAMENKKCLVLSRVSTFGQDVTQQTQVVENEAIKDGYNKNNIIIIEDIESAVKLSEEERNGLNRMKQYIEHDKDIDCVYVYEISRISRQPKIIYSVRDYLFSKKIQLIVLRPYMKMLNDDGTISETANIFMGIFASMAENEGYIRKARMRRGVEKAKAMGRHAGGQIPFGYSVDKNHMYNIDEEKAKYVKWIFESYVSGMSMRRIGKELLELGVFKSTYLTCVQNVNNIIHSDYYCGRRNGRPAIITEELYDKAQQICRRNTLHTDCKPTKRICKGILYDRNNGFLLSVNSATDTYYSKRAHGVSVSFKAIEPIIWEYSISKYKEYYAKNTEEKAKSFIEDIISLNIKMDNMKEKIKEKKQQLNKLEERIILGKITDELGDKMEAQINNELKSLENKLLEIQDKEHQKQILYNNLINKQIGIPLPDGTVFYNIEYNIENIDFESMDIDERMKLVHEVIEKVILDRPSRNILNIEIHNKLDNKIEKITLDTWRYKRL